MPVYSRRCLQTLRSAVLPVLPDDVKAVVQKLGLRRQRSCRSGRAPRARRARPVPVGNGAFTVVTDQSDNRLPSRRHRVPVCDLRHLTRINVQRHTTSAGRSVAFGSLNIRSLSPLKLEVLLVVFRDRQLDVMLLCETWHDADSVAIRSLRSQGFRVIERAPPRSSRLQTSLGVNHGGVAIVAAAGICMTAFSRQRLNVLLHVLRQVRRPVSCATHHAGGTLDVVCTRSDLATPTVDCQTIACCCGQCHYFVRRRSTPRQHVELGDRSTQTSSRPTCRHPLCVMIDVGKVWTVTHWVSSTMTRSHV